jgi:aerobic carbon-monoxide dehydrogenase medium subunit
MIPAAFIYESPRTVNEALALLESNPEAKVLAGGHSLLPAMKLRLATPPILIDLGRIPDLNYIRETGDRVAIGALTPHAAVASSDLLRRVSPLMAEAAESIGDVQVRNRGTIGGSLAQAHPNADYPAAILALEADIVALSRTGDRVIPAREFFTGIFTTALSGNEIITEVRVPKTTEVSVAYKKFAHPASGYAVVGVAAVVKKRGNTIESASIGITGVGGTPYRATEVENALRGQSVSAIADASRHAADGIEAIGDSFAAPDYRRHLAAVFTRRALETAVGRPRGK